MKRFFKNLCSWVLLHPLETLVVYLAYVLVRLMPVEYSSRALGRLARSLGKCTSAQRTARKNLTQTFPEKSSREITSLITSVWDNFGRILGEYPHLHQIDLYRDPRFEVIGGEIIDHLRKDGKPAVIFSAHLASWEIAIMAAKQRGLKLAQIYRTVNNPFVDFLVKHVQQGIGYEVLTKGRKDARKVLDVLKRGDHLFLLVDQKMNRGISVPFLGREAMTAPAAARLALQFKCPLVPARVERLGGFRFRVTYYPPLPLPKTSDKRQAIYEMVCEMNKIISEWVLACPDQWLWLHKRWPENR